MSSPAKLQFLIEKVDQRVTSIEDAAIIELTSGSNQVDFGSSNIEYTYNGTASLDIELINQVTDKSIRINSKLGASITVKDSGSTNIVLKIVYNGSTLDYGSVITDQPTFLLEYKQSETAFYIKN